MITGYVSFSSGVKPVLFEGEPNKKTIWCRILHLTGRNRFTGAARVVADPPVKIRYQQIRVVYHGNVIPL